MWAIVHRVAKSGAQLSAHKHAQVIHYQTSSPVVLTAKTKSVTHLILQLLASKSPDTRAMLEVISRAPALTKMSNLLSDTVRINAGELQPSQ